MAARLFQDCDHAVLGGHHEAGKNRDGILKLLRSPGIDSASLCRLAGRYDNSIPTLFLAPIDCSKIPAKESTLGTLN